LKSVVEEKLKSREKNTIANLYRYSDLSIEAIARQVDMEVDKVQEIIDDLVRNDALELLVEQSMARVEKIMTPAVISLDCSKTPREAAASMAEKEIGSVIVTKNGKPFGIVTHSDIVRWLGLRQKLIDVPLEGSVSQPLITIGRGATVEEAAKVMIKNQIHRLPVVDGEKLLGIVTVTDLAVFLSPSRRPGLALSVLQAITRGTK
jgi:CBS domain-containing protein